MEFSVKFSRVWIISLKSAERVPRLNERSNIFPRIHPLFIYLSLKQEKTVNKSDRLSLTVPFQLLFQNTVSLVSEDVRLFITCCYTINGGAYLPQ